MLIGIPKEPMAGETRVAATPQTVSQLIKLGFSVTVESGAGLAASFSDLAYEKAGATVSNKWQEVGGGGKTSKEEKFINQSDRTGHLQAVKSINL